MIPYKLLARKQAIIKSALRTAVGAKPAMPLPGMTELLVERPKKYLRGPALVIAQDTNSVPMVDRIRTTGNDPVSKDS